MRAQRRALDVIGESKPQTQNNNHHEPHTHQNPNPKLQTPEPQTLNPEPFWSQGDEAISDTARCCVGRVGHWLRVPASWCSRA
jgi:hypothetical protein